jgi:hypothetical protein
MTPSIFLFLTTGQPNEIVSEFIALGDKTIEPSDTENDNAMDTILTNPDNNDTTIVSHNIQPNNPENDIIDYEDPNNSL